MAGEMDKSIRHHASENQVTGKAHADLTGWQHNATVESSQR